MTRTAPNRPSKTARPAEPPAVPAPTPWAPPDISGAMLVFLDSLDRYLAGGAEDGSELLNPLDDGHSRFSRLADELELSSFERAVLMLALIGEMHPLRFRSFLQARYDRDELPPTGCVSRHLAMSLFDGDPTTLADDAPLLRWRLLLRRNEREEHSLAPLMVDPAVLAYVYGDERLNPRLTRFVQDPLADPDAARHADPKRLRELVAHLRSDPRATLQLHGRDASGQTDLAQAALGHLDQGRPTLHLSLGAFLEDEAHLERDLLLWERETRLRPLALSFDAHQGALELNPERWPAGRVERTVAAIVGHLHAPLVLLTEEPLQLGGAPRR